MTQKTISNKKVYRDYFIEDTWECGIELIGCEVKSLREGKVNFADSYARVTDTHEIFLHNLEISPYEQGSYMNAESNRMRKLLLHKREIKKIYASATIKQLAVVPTKIYFNNRGLAKIEIGLAKGKKSYDKRETIKKRDVDRDIGRTLRTRVRK
jgi:SsrA-binding protein